MKIFVFLIFALVAGFVNPTEAMVEEEVQFVQAAYTSLSQLDTSLNEIPPQTIFTILNLFDYDIFFDKIVQDIRDKLHSAEFEDIKTTFRSLFAKHIAKKGVRFSDKRLDHIRFVLTKKDPGESVVTLKGKTGQTDVAIEFMIKKEGNFWKIKDISVNGANLSRQYRGQFNRIFRQEGFTGLISRMEKKMASL